MIKRYASLKSNICKDSKSRFHDAWGLREAELQCQPDYRADQ